ncbi:MAG: hypothetical protein AAGJ31_10575, partial [Verrucomicrobiota bacterium]
MIKEKKRRWRNLGFMTCLMLASILSLSCHRVSPGPLPLEGKQHLKNYLVGHRAWQSWQEAESYQVFWSFDEDGTFSTWIDNIEGDGLGRLYPETFPAGTERATGRWQLIGENVPFALQWSEMQ